MIGMAHQSFMVVINGSVIGIIKRYIKEVQPWFAISSYEEYKEYQKLFKTISLNLLVLVNVVWQMFSKKSYREKLTHLH